MQKKHIIAALRGAGITNSQGPNPKNLKTFLRTLIGELLEANPGQTLSIESKWTGPAILTLLWPSSQGNEDIFDTFTATIYQESAVPHRFPLTLSGFIQMWRWKLPVYLLMRGKKRILTVVLRDNGVSIKMP